MGCDVHAYLEVRVGKGWHYYGEIRLGRDYPLFGKLAGVRDSSVDPVVAPRGLPKDVSAVTRLLFEHYENDGHSHSWLSATEMSEVDRWWQATHNTGLSLWSRDNGFYFFGDYLRTEQFRPRRGKSRRDELPVDDVRLVFWFDS